MRTTSHSASDKDAEDFELGLATRSHAGASQDQGIFWSLLHDSAREALRNALGEVILGILAGQKMLENPDNAVEFTERLRSVFGTSGAKTLEFIIAKELYQRLNLPFNPDGSFDYGAFIDTAKTMFTKRHSKG